MFNAQNFIKEKIDWLKKEIGDKEAIVAASGGVDSSVTAILGHKILGDKLKVIFLDDGLMRQGEPEAVKDIFKKIGINLTIYDVKKDFFDAMKGLTDPEEKRKKFRETFYNTFTTIAKDSKIKIVLQGTIAADVIETTKGVKTQHNVLEQIGINPLSKFGFQIVEPVIDLFKPEVRKVAKALGLPNEVVERKPFPGPGLSVRTLGEITPEKIRTVRKASLIVEEETKNIASFQAFAVLLNDKATGVTKDGTRIYGNIVVIRVINSTDAMTATPTKIPWDVLEKIKNRITTELPNITRVLYDITTKPPSTIEFE
ncbi:MAG: glutamine-hydrolyzing GMP synthase subunit GuaA [Candidatus Helarchaeota archaeon]|nr:glutamine-hydrolyzing GMP synthase subunit GuaA [Candidatus Helarchaeota archaeon]